MSAGEGKRRQLLIISTKYRGRPLNARHIMTIILYRTRLCPRCSMARKHLLDLTRHRPDLIVEERDILRDLIATGRDGITMIPAIKIGDRVLSGIYLDRRRIADFLQQTGCL